MSSRTRKRSHPNETEDKTNEPPSKVTPKKINKTNPQQIPLPTETTDNKENPTGNNIATAPGPQSTTFVPSRSTSPFREEASKLNRPKQGRMGKRLLRPRSNSAGAKVQVSSPHTLSQGGTQILISEDNNNKNINQDLDQHMDNTTLPATADSLIESD